MISRCRYWRGHCFREPQVIRKVAQQVCETKDKASVCPSRLLIRWNGVSGDVEKVARERVCVDQQKCLVERLQH